MSQERETHEIIATQNNLVLVCRSWINGREKQKVDGAILKSVTTEGTGENMAPRMTETILASQQNAAIEAVVISVGGVEENVLDTVLDMHVKDFEFVVKHCEQIVDGNLDEKKEDASEMNTIKSSEQAEDESQILVSP